MQASTYRGLYVAVHTPHRAMNSSSTAQRFPLATVVSEHRKAKINTAAHSLLTAGANFFFPNNKLSLSAWQLFLSSSFSYFVSNIIISLASDEYR